MRWLPVVRTAVKWCSAALLVLCIAFGAITSRWFIEWCSPDLSCEAGVLAWKGMIDIYWSPVIGDFYLWQPPPGFSMGRARSPYEKMDPWRWKPAWDTSPYGWSVSVPIWLPTAVAALGFLPLAWLDRRAANLARMGRCRSCGYDRRGLAADAKCPECGTVPALASK